MKEIFKIAVALTVSCLIAGGVMGGVFMATAKAKKRNELLNVQQTVAGLLGYSQARPAPSNLKIRTIHRYIVEDEGGIRSGYLVPVFAAGKTEYEFWVVDLNGHLMNRHQLNLSPERASDEQDRRSAIAGVVGPRKTIRHADEISIAQLEGKRLAYIIPAKFPGYKNVIHVMVALDPDFSVRGVEITAHEEDPGLGGEIEKEYFKNQFQGKAFEKIKVLTVTKSPLAEEHKRYLETKEWGKRALSEQDIRGLRKKYQNEEIHAISGATISSSAVATGVKRIVRNSVHRITLLEQVVRENAIQGAF